MWKLLAWVQQMELHSGPGPLSLWGLLTPPSCLCLLLIFFMMFSLFPCIHRNPTN